MLDVQNPTLLVQAHMKVVVSRNLPSMGQHGMLYGHTVEGLRKPQARQKVKFCSQSLLASKSFNLSVPDFLIC